MNIVINDSLGHVGKPLAEMLVAKGHAVTVISCSAGKQEAIHSGLLREGFDRTGQRVVGR